MHLSEQRLNRIRGRAREISEQPLPSVVQVYLDGGPGCSPAATTPPSEDERRCSERHELQSEVTVRKIGGFNFEVALSNLSSGGCRVKLLEAGEVGESVIARFPQLEPLGSRICWTDGPETGVEFNNRIHPAVLDLLISRLPGDADA
jgi:hypothetical protein